VPDLGDYHAFKSTSNDSGGGTGSGGGMGCLTWFVIGVVVILLIYFIVKGASWEAIECLLGFGLIAFLIARKLG